MNTAITMEAAGLSLCNEKPLEGVLSFLASRSKEPSRELSKSAGEVFDGIAGVMDQLLTILIEKRTAGDFSAAFNEAFPKYFAMTLSLSRFAHAVVPPQVIDRLVGESLCEMESDFRAKALTVFGTAVRDQAMFTVWTLRKINDLVTQIAATKIEKSKKKEDREFATQFNIHVVRAHFSLDCLNIALRLDRPIYPEVMGELTDGLRSMVNAYAWARRGAALRAPTVEAPVESRAWDEEDENLLSASMQDMALMDEGETI